MASVDTNTLLKESPMDALMDDLADRIAARLRKPGSAAVGIAEKLIINALGGKKLTLTIKEAAVVLDICENTVRECVHTGQIPAVRFQGAWKISIPALLKKLENPPAIAVHE